MANPTCPHNVVFGMPKNVDPKLSALRMCPVADCGATFILVPIKLRDNPRFKQIIDATIKDIKDGMQKI